jgi:hypothetical protein
MHAVAARGEMEIAGQCGQLVLGLRVVSRRQPCAAGGGGERSWASTMTRLTDASVSGTPILKEPVLTNVDGIYT